MTIKVHDRSQTFAMSEDGDFLCAHEQAYIEPACCTSAGSSGYIECGCAGQDSLICPNPDCTGLTINDNERLFNERY